MSALKETFEKTGMQSVVTYLNTSNVIFIKEGLSIMEITDILENAINNKFELQIKIVVRSLDEYKNIMDSLPELWKNDKLMRSDAMFLWDEVDNEELLDNLVIKSGIDRVKHVTGLLLWSVDRDNVTKSGMTKLIRTNLYKKMTIKNVNTTRKTYEFMEDTSSKFMRR